MAENLWIARNQSIGIGVESTRGVGVDPDYWLNSLSFSFSDNPQRAMSEASFGGIWGGDEAPVTLKSAEGDFEAEMTTKSFGAVLKATLGSVSSSSVTGDGYKHTYTLQNDNEHPSLSIVTRDPIGDNIFELAMVSSLEITAEPDSIISYTVDFMSKSRQDTDGTPTFANQDERKFVGRNVTFEHASSAGNLGSGTKEKLKSLTLTFEKNAAVQNTLSTVQPEDIMNQRFDITGEIELNYENRDQYDLVNTPTNKAVRIKILHDDTVTGGSDNFEFRIDLSKVAFEEWEPDFSMDEVVTQSLSFTALYDAGGNNNLINNCYLVNEEDGTLY